MNSGVQNYSLVTALILRRFYAENLILFLLLYKNMYEY